MKNFFAVLGAILVIALMVVLVGGAFYYGKLSGRIPSVADIPTSEAALAAATRIAEHTQTPGPAGEQALATLMPWQDVYQLGDAELLRQSLMGVYASAGFDLRVSSIVDTGASGIYCIQGHIPDHAEEIPLVTQVQAGTITLIPGTRYCVGVAKIGELWGGVPQIDLQKFELEELEHRSVDPNERTITHTETVDIELHVRFGLLTHSVQPGNEIKKTFDDPNGVLREWIDLVKRMKFALFGGEPAEAEFFRAAIDRADNLANELATLELIAPTEPDGSRSMRNLDELKRLIEWHFNSPSPDPANPWPFDNLYPIAVEKAKRAGYTGIGEFKVVLEWPYEEGVWYYLINLDSDPKRVIETNDLDKFKHNLYPLYRDEIGFDWVPQWNK